MAGFCVPIFVAKSKWLFNEPMWEGYQTIWLPSPIPRSDIMVEKELDRLERLLGRYPEATLVGHSLGGWWASNIALRPQIQLHKLVLWTPLCHEQDYPIFNVTPRYHPCNQPAPDHAIGPDRVLVLGAKDDLIVPAMSHAHKLVIHFAGQAYHLLGGHFYQRNHQSALNYMKNWIELV